MKSWFGIGALCVCAAGCHAPVTEIVLVVDSDLTVPTQIVAVTIDGAGVSLNIDLQAGGVALPATLGLLPVGGDPPLALTVEATRQGQVVAKRGVTNVRFVQGQRRALLMSLLRACACLAPPCPAPSDPQCADLDGPELVPLDPGNLPELPRSVDGGADGPRDTGVDVPQLDGSSRDLGAMSDSGNPDQGPPPLGLGSACSTGDQCDSGNCADGVCCADACVCGQCNGAKSGTCAPAPVDTDPKGSCGAYTCDSAGKCRTGCNDAFGSCSTSCKNGNYCDGAICVPSNIMASFFCVAGGCECQAGLVCERPDGGGAGVCQ